MVFYTCLLDMIAKKNKISRSDYQKIFKQSKIYQTQSLTIRVARLNTHTQCSCVVAKKAIRLSPERHIIKRRIYTIVRNLLPQIPPLGIIIHYKKGNPYGFSALKKQMDSVLDSYLLNK